MGEHSFVDRYIELDIGYLKHKQEQYKDYKQPKLLYTEELFWDKLVHLGWRKDHITTECLVLVCPACEQSITRVVLKDKLDIRGLLSVDERKHHHQRHYCKATGKAEQE